MTLLVEYRYTMRNTVAIVVDLGAVIAWLVEVNVGDVSWLCTVVS